MGHVGGVFYSLGYIRKVAIIQRPMACITPSIVTYAILCAGWLGLLSQFISTLELGILGGYFALITLAFAFITRAGFQKIAALPEPQGFPIQ